MFLKIVVLCNDKFKKMVCSWFNVNPCFFTFCTVCPIFSNILGIKNGRNIVTDEEKKSLSVANHTVTYKLNNRNILILYFIVVCITCFELSCYNRTSDGKWLLFFSFSKQVLKHSYKNCELKKLSVQFLRYWTLL